MHLPTLDLLRAPDAPDGPPLTLAEMTSHNRGEVIGGLVCAEDAGCFPIRDGILDLLPDDPPLSPAQWSNSLWPSARFYEQIWRVRVLSRFAGESFPIAREMALLNHWLMPERGGLFVDIGTSHGLYARNIARELRDHGAIGTIIALDVAFPMLQRAQQLIRAKGYTTIDLIRTRAQALPLPSGSVDGVVNGGTFNEMGAQAQALAEVRRVLKPDGRYVMLSLLPGRTAFGRAIQRLFAMSGITFPTQDETNTLLTNAGLTITDQERSGIALFTCAVPG
jgi:SAM-dependent methyltransferase